MQTAAEELQKLSQGQADQEKPLAAAQEQQATSLDNLLQALALLDENQPQNQQSQGQDQQQQQQQQDQQDQQQQQQQQMNANQLLQLIRDREAQRRQDKKQRAPVSGGTVDKDW